MAKPEDDDIVTRRTAIRREEGALTDFFDAARAEAFSPSARFMDAVLADAADANAARTRHRDMTTPAPARRRWSWAHGTAPFGRLAGAAALTGCLALGFWAGSLGAGASLADGALWAEATNVDAAVAGVDEFFDLADAEG